MHINQKKAAEDAAELGVKSWVENSRFKLSGSVANVRRVLAAQGLDFIRDGGTIWSLCRNGALVGTLVRSETEDFAYFYSAI